MRQDMGEWRGRKAEGLWALVRTEYERKWQLRHIECMSDNVLCSLQRNPSRLHLSTKDLLLPCCLLQIGLFTLSIPRENGTNEDYQVSGRMVGGSCVFPEVVLWHKRRDDSRTEDTRLILVVEELSEPDGNSVSVRLDNLMLTLLLHSVTNFIAKTYMGRLGDIRI